MSATELDARVARIAIVGLGLIGGSIARGLCANGCRASVVGCVATVADAARAVELGVVTEATADLDDACADADLIVVAVPVGAMADVFAQLATAASPQAVITDVGSTKSSVIAAARATLGARLSRFVPGHPIAGTERSGLEAGFAELYRDRRAIVTPTDDTDPDALACVEALWRALGARVSAMDADHHDEVLAATSHLPHVLAFALVDTLARMAEQREIFEYAAGGFADFTRIASSDPDLWRDIVIANRDAVMPVLDRYIADLDVLRTAIDARDGATLTGVFARAREARDRFALTQPEPGGHHA